MSEQNNPLANLDEDTQLKIQEMQVMEQNFQRLLMQKNAFSMENNEADLILKEVEKAEGEISKLVGGQIVIKTTKEKVIEEMKHKKELMELRLKDIEKQEKEFTEQMEKLRDEVMAKIKG